MFTVAPCFFNVFTIMFTQSFAFCMINLNYCVLFFSSSSPSFLQTNDILSGLSRFLWILSRAGRVNQPMRRLTFLSLWSGSRIRRTCVLSETTISRSRGWVEDAEGSHWQGNTGEWWFDCQIDMSYKRPRWKVPKKRGGTSD